MNVLWHMVETKEHMLVVTGWLRFARDGARNQLQGWKSIRQVWFEVLTAVLMTMQVSRDDAPCLLTGTNVSQERSAFDCRVKQSKKSHVHESFQVHMRFKLRTMNVNVISSPTSCNTAISTAEVACHIRPYQTARLLNMVCRCDTWNLQCFYASLKLFNFRNCFGTWAISRHSRLNHPGILRKKEECSNIFVWLS
jgi:hypothetical protein